MHPEVVLTMAHARQQNLRRSSSPRGITPTRVSRTGRPRWRSARGSHDVIVPHRLRIGHRTVHAPSSTTLTRKD
jgi:hypothetical protein